MTCKNGKCGAKKNRFPKMTSKQSQNYLAYLRLKKARNKRTYKTKKITEEQKDEH